MLPYFNTRLIIFAITFPLTSCAVVVSVTITSVSEKERLCAAQSGTLEYVLCIEDSYIEDSQREQLEVGIKPYQCIYIICLSVPLYCLGFSLCSGNDFKKNSNNKGFLAVFVVVHAILYEISS
ncbi:hypothetical protein F4779DRAFT_346035 [Xylariaceae sp. FL0662B]|nr:hypothetical protein F4779DRAFT_346035 [Xylariaceae sp. FL0662B]